MSENLRGGFFWLTLYIRQSCYDDLQTPLTRQLLQLPNIPNTMRNYLTVYYQSVQCTLNRKWKRFSPAPYVRPDATTYVASFDLLYTFSISLSISADHLSSTNNKLTDWADAVITSNSQRMHTFNWNMLVSHLHAACNYTVSGKSRKLHVEQECGCSVKKQSTNGMQNKCWKLNLGPKL